MVEIKDQNGNLVPIRALLDTGTDQTLILREFVNESQCQGHELKTVEWTTMGGNLQQPNKI